MSTEPTNLSTLLKAREIYDILDGDKHFFSTDLDEEVSLPYQSGPMLVETLNRFGVPTEYGSDSRWMYVEKLLGYCIDTQQVSKLFSFFFDLNRFHKDLQDLPTDEIPKRHRAIVTAAISAINNKLLFGHHQLRQQGNIYTVVPIDNSPVMETPAIEKVDRNYVKDVAERAQQDIGRGEFDSALTKARTILDDVFCQVIERKGE